MIILSNSGSSSGLKEWVLQRLTALYMSFYFIFISICFFSFDNFNYTNWIEIFSSFYFKIITILFVFSLSLHSSIGMSIVLTDYIKHTYLRIILDFFVNIILLSYIFCIMQILWSFK